MQEWIVSQPVTRYLVRQPVGAEHDVDVVPGLRHDVVQSLDLVVSQAAATQLYTVVVAMAPALSEHDREVISQALRSTRRPAVVFLLEMAPGNWAAQCAPGVDPAAAAVAVGVVGAAMGRVNGEGIGIDVNGQTWQVAAKFDGRRWRCMVG